MHVDVVVFDVPYNHRIVPRRRSSGSLTLAATRKHDRCMEQDYKSHRGMS